MKGKRNSLQRIKIKLCASVVDDYSKKKFLDS